jgi:hypothetical protein
MPKRGKFEKRWVAMAGGLLNRDVSASEEEALRAEAREVWRAEDKAGRDDLLGHVRSLAWLTDLPASAAVEAAGDTLVAGHLTSTLGSGALASLLEAADPAVGRHPGTGVLVTRADAVAGRALLSADPTAARFDADAGGAAGIGAWEAELRGLVAEADGDAARRFALLDAYAAGLEASWAGLSVSERADALVLFEPDTVVRPSIMSRVTGSEAGALEGLMRQALDTLEETLPVKRKDLVAAWRDLAGSLSGDWAKGEAKKALKAEAKASWDAMDDADRTAAVDFNLRLGTVADAAGGAVEAAGEDAVLDFLHARQGPAGTALMREVLGEVGAVGWHGGAGAFVTMRDARAWVAIEAASPDDEAFAFRDLSGDGVRRIAEAIAEALPGMEGYQAEHVARLDVHAAGLEASWDDLSRSERAEVLGALRSGEGPEAELAQAFLGARSVEEAATLARTRGGFDPLLRDLPDSAMPQEGPDGTLFSGDAVFYLRYGDVTWP